MLKVTTLQKRADFLCLKAEGKRVFRASFVAQWRPVARTDVRVGYTASGKAIGNAVKRNRARRRLKAAVDLLLRLNPAVRGREDGQGLELALIAKPVVLEQEFSILVRDLRTVLAEMGLVADGPDNV